MASGLWLLLSSPPAPTLPSLLGRHGASTRMEQGVKMGSCSSLGGKSLTGSGAREMPMLSGGAVTIQRRWTGRPTAPLAKVTRLSQDFPGRGWVQKQGRLWGPGQACTPSQPEAIHTWEGDTKGALVKGKTRANLKMTWALNLLPYSLTGPLAEGRSSMAWGSLTTNTHRHRWTLGSHT